MKTIILYKIIWGWNPRGGGRILVTIISPRGEYIVRYLYPRVKKRGGGRNIVSQGTTALTPWLFPIKGAWLVYFAPILWFALARFYKLEGDWELQSSISFFLRYRNRLFQYNAGSINIVYRSLFAIIMVY